MVSQQCISLCSSLAGKFTGWTNNQHNNGRSPLILGQRRHFLLFTTTSICWKLQRITVIDYFLTYRNYLVKFSNCSLRSLESTLPNIGSELVPVLHHFIFTFLQCIVLLKLTLPNHFDPSCHSFSNPNLGKPHCAEGESV